MVYPADLGWEQENELLLKHIKEIHAESRETYAWPRAHAGLTRGLGLLVNRKRVARLTRQTGIQGAVPVGDVVVDPYLCHGGRVRREVVQDDMDVNHLKLFASRLLGREWRGRRRMLQRPGPKPFAKLAGTPVRRLP